MDPGKVMEDYNRFIVSNADNKTTPADPLKTEIFGGYRWQYDPAKQVQGTRDATGQYVRLGPAKEPGTDTGGKTPFELWQRLNPKGTYDDWIKVSKQEDRGDAASAVKDAMASYSKMQSLDATASKTNRQFSMWNPKTWFDDPALGALAQQASGDYEQKRIDAVSKLTNAGMPVPSWLTQQSPSAAGAGAANSQSSKPAGATHTGIGHLDKKKHWLDAQGNDLGLAE